MKNYSWQRPLTDSRNYPFIYLVFEANGERFRIEDLCESRFDEAIKLMSENYFKSDPLMASKNILDDEISKQEVIENWRLILQQKISLVCFKENSDEIIALDFLCVMNEEEMDRKANGESLSEIKNVFHFIKDIFFNPYEHYNVERLVRSCGRYVNENYVNISMVSQIFKARFEMAKFFDIELSSDIVCEAELQAAAISNDYEENFSIELKKLPKMISDGYFPGIHEQFLKVMSKRNVI
jgi:hypothetical protein